MLDVNEQSDEGARGQACPGAADQGSDGMNPWQTIDELHEDMGAYLELFALPATSTDRFR